MGPTAGASVTSVLSPPTHPRPGARLCVQQAPTQLSLPSPPTALNPKARNCNLSPGHTAWLEASGDGAERSGRWHPVLQPLVRPTLGLHPCLRGQRASGLQVGSQAGPCSFISLCHQALLLCELERAPCGQVQRQGLS